MTTSTEGRPARSDPTSTAVRGLPSLGLRDVDERLLRVALGPAARAASEWAQLRTVHQWDEIDDARAYPLLPLVGVALLDAAVDEPEIGLMTGLRRHAFVTQQLLLADLAEALDLATAAGGRPLLVGGVPLALECYPDATLRPTREAEVLVDVGAVAGVLAALEAAGWTSPVARPVSGLTRRVSSLRVVAPDERGDVVLHWRLAPWLTDRDDPGLWAAAQPCALPDRQSLGAGPDDLLLHVVTRAYRTGWAVEPRWVADVAMLLRRVGADLDWDRFLHRVQLGGLAPPVHDALAYANALVNITVPGAVIDALTATPIGRGPARRYAAGSSRFDGRRRSIPGHDLLVDWHRQTFNLGTGPRAHRFLPFVLGRTGAEHVWSVPGTVVRRRRADV